MGNTTASSRRNRKLLQVMMVQDQLILRELQRDQTTEQRRQSGANEVDVIEVAQQLFKDQHEIKSNFNFLLHWNILRKEPKLRAL
ncbi:hypothetical protein CDL15_Pgr011626 [Punica granatum]|uniref:Uncharacterized protein n=1 Tax=Punica granatum TaxID=22663 RepID=A0A218XIF4_PUNGR|nr:hypothetical protein CDL15_Pgr011626 [Punica granatum]